MKKVNLIYTKQGDDFKSSHSKAKENLSTGENLVIKSLRLHAELLRVEALKLESVAHLYGLLKPDEQKQVKIQSDSNAILIDGPEKFMKLLKAQKLI